MWDKSGVLRFDSEDRGALGHRGRRWGAGAAGPGGDADWASGKAGGNPAYRGNVPRAT